MNRLEHLIGILGEECSETQQRASKAQRFGLNEIQPHHTLTNSERIIREFNDIYAMMEMLKDEGHLDRIIDRNMIEAKKVQVEKYLEYCKEIGTLS